MFYAGAPVPHARNIEQLDALIDGPEPLYVITLSRHARKIDEHFAGTFEVLLRRREFLGPGEMLVLLRPDGAGVFIGCGVLTAVHHQENAIG